MAFMINRWLFNSCMRTCKSLELINRRIGTSILPAALHSTCSIGLLSGFPCCLTKEFIRLSICSTMAGTLPLCTASTSSDPESRDSTIVLLLNFDSILNQNAFLVMEYAQLYEKTKRCIDVPQRCVPSGMPKICFYWILVQNIQKHENW